MSNEIIDEIKPASNPSPENQDDRSGTPGEIEIEAPRNSAEDATEEVTIGTNSDDDEPTKEDLERKASETKLSTLEKRANDLDRTRKAEIAVLDELFRDDPKAYEKWRQNYKKKFNVDPGEHSTIYGTTQSSKEASSIADSPNVDINKTVQDQVQQVLRGEREKEENLKGFQEFVAAVPEMDPEKMTDEQRPLASQMWSRIATVAAAMKQANPNMTAGQAFITAYNSLPENVDKQRQDQQEIGELAGKASAYIQGTASGSMSASAPQNNKRTVRMTASQRATYERLKRNNPKVAEKFAASFA